MSAERSRVASHPPLILASSSRYRAQVAAESGLIVTPIAPHVDERALDQIGTVCGARVLAGSLALAKAESVRARVAAGDGDPHSSADPGGSTMPVEPGTVIIAADQVGERLARDGSVTFLTKPGSAADARAVVLAHSEATVVLTNGLVAMNAQTGEWAGCFDVHHIEMGPITAEQADGYVEHCKPFDCMGAYRIEDGQRYPQWNFVTAVRGDSGIDGIMGLPIEPLKRLLARVSGCSSEG